MSTNIVYNGITYTIPATNDVAWGDEVTRFLTAIPTGMLTKVGGSWALTGSDLDLGATYGLASLYYKSRSASISSTGILRLARLDEITWRNNADGGDLALGVDASDFLTWNSIALVDISTPQLLTNKVIDAMLNSIVNIMDANVAPNAAIAYSKLAVNPQEIPWDRINAVLQIRDSDIAPDAAIAGSKIDGDFGSTAIITAGGLSLGTTFHVTLKGDPSEDYDFEFPATDGATGQALVKSSTGILEWASVPGLALDHNNIMVGDPTNLPQAIDTSSAGDVLADDVTGLTIKALAITDAMISASAGIAFSKLEASPLPSTGGTLTGLLTLDNLGLVIDVAGTTPAAPVTGQIYWDKVNQTASLKLANTDVTLQIGQEMNIYCVNNTAAIIANGAIVYVSGTLGDLPSISLAKADLAATSDGVIGISTEAIGIGANGYVTTIGKINDVKTDVDCDGTALNVGDVLYLSPLIAGGFTKTISTSPDHQVKIGSVLKVGALDGIVLCRVEIGQHLAELHDVLIANLANRDVFEYDATAGAWKNYINPNTITKEPTGFADPTNVGISYDVANRQVVITHTSGTIVYYIAGIRYTRTSPYTPLAHDVANGTYFFTFMTGDVPTWTTSFPGFDDGAYVAYINYGATTKFGMRECHGLMPWQAWEEFHRVVGTYRISGGDVLSASWTANTDTVAAVTPVADVMVLRDEDLPTTIPAGVNGATYTRVHFDTGLAVFTTSSTFPYPVTGAVGTGDPQYNLNPITGTALTSITQNNRWFNVYCLFIPVTSDATSQAYRHVWMTGQVLYTSLVLAQAEDFRSLFLGDLTTIFPEILPYVRVSYRRDDGYNNTYSTRMETGCITYLAGSRAGLINVSGYVPTDHSTLTGRSSADQHPASAITNTPSPNLIATTVQGALDELQIDVDTRLTPAGAEVLTNKDIDGGTASNTSRMTVPKASLATLQALTRKEGTIVYADDVSTLFADDGAALQPVGSGGGSGAGRKNYIQNPSASVSETSNWTASNFTVTRDTSTAVPRETTTGSAFKLVSSNTNATFISDARLLDDVDLSKKLAGEIAINVADAANWTISVLASATAGGTYAALPMSTDTSGVTTLPATAGVFKFSFDTVAATPYIKFQIKSAATAKTAYFSDILLTPDGSTVVGAVVGDWLSYTPTYGGGFGTVASSRMFSRRIGDSVQVAGSFTCGNVAAAAYSISLPVGLNNNALLRGSAASVVGNWWNNSSNPTQIKRGALFAQSTNSPTILFSLDDYTTGSSPLTAITGGLLNSAIVNVDFTVPIAEWAGSGTCNVAGNDVEYASNDGSGGTTLGVTYDTGMTYTSAGNAVPALAADTTAGQTRYRVRFQTPIQSSDKLELEVLGSGATTWVPVASCGGITSMTFQIGLQFGMSTEAISGSSTDIYVAFGRSGRVTNSAAYGTAVGAAFSGSGYKWRVRKVSATSVAGFEMHKPGISAGLVPAQGLDGRTDGVAVPAGKVGEVLYLNLTSDVVYTGDQGSARAGTDSLVLTKGNYMAIMEGGGGAVATYVRAALQVKQTSGATFESNQFSILVSEGGVVPATSNKTHIVRISSDLTLGFFGYVTGLTGTNVYFSKYNTEIFGGLGVYYGCRVKFIRIA